MSLGRNASISSGAEIIDLASFGVLIFSAGIAATAGSAGATLFASGALPNAEAVIGIAEAEDDADDAARALASGRTAAGAAAGSALRDDGKSSNESSWPF